MTHSQTHSWRREGKITLLAETAAPQQMSEELTPRGEARPLKGKHTALTGRPGRSRLGAAGSLDLALAGWLAGRRRGAAEADEASKQANRRTVGSRPPPAELRWCGSRGREAVASLAFPSPLVLCAALHATLRSLGVGIYVYTLEKEGCLCRCPFGSTAQRWWQLQGSFHDL